jgi:hypothetical protein
MSANKHSSKSGTRNYVAMVTLIVSGSAIIGLAIVAIIVKPTEIMTIFNIVLPVFASWVGTILAYYFGRENFEAANLEVRKMVQQITPEQRAKEPISKHMKLLNNMVYSLIPAGKDIKDIKLSDLREKLGNNITRLPVIDADRKPLYMIHESSIDKYVSTGGQNTDTLKSFIDAQKSKGIEFGLNKGFIVVAEDNTIAEAKQELEKIRSCQDIFITKDGKPDEILLGWISNVRMVKYLEG